MNGDESGSAAPVTETVVETVEHTVTETEYVTVTETVIDDGGGDGGNGECDPNYSDCVPAYDVYGDVDCADVYDAVEVYGSDPHGLDGDGDGFGCE